MLNSLAFLWAWIVVKFQAVVAWVKSKWVNYESDNYQDAVNQNGKDGEQ